MTLKLKAPMIQVIADLTRATSQAATGKQIDIISETNKIPALEIIKTYMSDLPEDEQKMAYEYMDKIKDSLKDAGIPWFLSSLIFFLAHLSLLPSIIGASTTPLIEKKIAQGARKAHRPALLGIAEIFSGWWRKEITREEAAERLAKLGYEDKDIDLLNTVIRPVPSVQDIITFAVREVYTPAIAAEFGQYEGVNEVLANAKEDLENIGMSGKNMEKYWAAHWVLPSVMQGYEMLHRGVIDEGKLDMLFKALDIMPGWREDLKKISYSPYTRVDVRRMHKIGVLTREQVLRSYKDIGFDEEKAEKMTEFTVQYNKEPAPEDLTFSDYEEESYRKMSKSDILKGYRTKLLSQSDAVEFLKLLEYSSETIDYMLSREDFSLEQEKQDKFLSLIRIAYQKEIWTETKVIESLGELNIPANYTEYLLEIWELEKEVKSSMPSKAELFRFWKKEIITESVLRQELSKSGYQDKYINWYVQDKIA